MYRGTVREITGALKLQKAFQQCWTIPTPRRRLSTQR
jgi:hypothetical protein